MSPSAKSARIGTIAAMMPTPAKSQNHSGGSNAQTNQTNEFEMHASDHRKPIPEAVVELRTDVFPTADLVVLLHGTLVKWGKYEILVAADQEGRLALKLPKAPQRFDAFIDIPGFGPYWAGWSSTTTLNRSRLTSRPS